MTSWKWLGLLVAASTYLGMRRTHGLRRAHVLVVVTVAVLVSYQALRYGAF